MINGVLYRERLEDRLEDRALKYREVALFRPRDGNFAAGKAPQEDAGSGREKSINCLFMILQRVYLCFAAR